MEKTGLITRLDDNLSDERTSYKLREQTAENHMHKTHQSSLRDTVKAIGKSKDVGLILRSERSLLENERMFYSNSPEMAKSLENALSELGGAEGAYKKVQNPDSYKEVDRNLVSHKSRSGDLPLDEARKFFDSQKARLLNMGKSRLTDEEKEILKLRRNNIIAGKSAYIELQKQALGIEQKSSSRTRDDALEM